jgi:hypothetical protein
MTVGVPLMVDGMSNTPSGQSFRAVQAVRKGMDPKMVEAAAKV